MVSMSNFGSYKLTAIFLISIICALFLLSVLSKTDQFSSVASYALLERIFLYENQTNSTVENSIRQLDPTSGTPNEDEFVKNPFTNVYELNGKPVIWEYWHSPDLPLYVRLLVQAMQCRNPEFHVITVHDSSIYKYLPDLNVPKAVLDALSGNHKGDLFRVPVLYKYGGIYTDIDTFVLDKVYPAYDLLRNYDIITPKWGNEIFALGALGPVRAGTSLFGELRRKQLKLLHEKFPGFMNGSRADKPNGDPLGWGELMLTQTFGTENTIGPGKTNYLAYDGYRTVGQLEGQGLQEEVWTPFRNVSHKIIPMRSTPFLFLHHGKMKKKFWDIKKIEELLPSEPTIFSAFIGCALLDCMPEFDKLVLSGPHTQTPRTQLNLNELLEALRKMDRKVCYQLHRRRDTYFLEKLSSQPLKNAERKRRRK